MAQLRPKIVKLARIIGSVTGIMTKIDENAPEYYSLVNIVSDDEADIAIAAGLRKERTAGWLAKKVGKTVEEIQPLLDNLVYYGVFRRTYSAEAGQDVYYMQIYAPGILEMMVNNVELAAAHPEVNRAFGEYTRNLAATMGSFIPDGYGLMRVIPVQSAVEDNPDTAEFEKLSYYLDKYDKFSVSPCSCRASRTAIGDGCGHLDEDMCIQMGKGAEHYIRSGRAREITKQEALEIIKRAEDNGLVHEVNQALGFDEVNAICNCCGCSCYALRIAELFRSPDGVSSNFIAKVDKDKCVACGQCVENCQTNAVKLGQKLCTTDPHVSDAYQSDKEVPWDKKSYNVDYRTTRTDVMESGTAPCKAQCPAHVPVQGYIKLAAQGRYTEALELIKKENPFPAVCGRICNKACEDACTRGDIDSPIAIDDIKKFIAEKDLEAKHRFVPKMVNQTGKPYEEKIAVIGAGPAGLSCAYYLAVKGYPVTVYEKEKALGGMLTMGIPSFRLEKDVINAEIKVLKDLGVKFKTGVEVGKDISLDKLREQGFKAFYLAVGASKGAKVGCPGDELPGVFTGIDFLREINLGGKPAIGKNVAVIGGGNVAIDVARAAVRLGAKTTVVYRRDRDAMPAADDEVEEAIEEGVKFMFLAAPAEISGEGKAEELKVEIMELKAGKPVGTGKFETLNVSAVISAIGQKIDLGGMQCIATGAKGEVKVSLPSYQTSVSDVFAGGDVVTGPKFAIDAIAAGKEGAVSIHRYVHPGQSQVIGRDRRDYKAMNTATAGISVVGFDTAPRQKASAGSAKEAKKTFKDLRGTLTEEQMKIETSRCLGCGAAVVDESLCVGCGICTTKCKFDAIRLEKVTDYVGAPYFKALLGAAGNAPAAVAKLVTKKIARK